MKKTAISKVRYDKHFRKAFVNSKTFRDKVMAQMLAYPADEDSIGYFVTKTDGKSQGLFISSRPIGDRYKKVNREAGAIVIQSDVSPKVQKAAGS